MLKTTWKLCDVSEEIKRKTIIYNQTSPSIDKAISTFKKVAAMNFGRGDFIIGFSGSGSRHPLARYLCEYFENTFTYLVYYSWIIELSKERIVFFKTTEKQECLISAIASCKNPMSPIYNSEISFIMRDV